MSNGYHIHITAGFVAVAQSRRRDAARLLSEANLHRASQMA